MRVVRFEEGKGGLFLNSLGEDLKEITRPSHGSVEWNPPGLIVFYYRKAGIFHSTIRNWCKRWFPCCSCCWFRILCTWSLIPPFITGMWATGISDVFHLLKNISPKRFIALLASNNTFFFGWPSSGHPGTCISRVEWWDWYQIEQPLKPAQQSKVRQKSDLVLLDYLREEADKSRVGSSNRAAVTIITHILLMTKNTTSQATT